MCSPYILTDLQTKAQQASSVIPPGELHGLVCGFSAAGGSEFSFSEFVQLAGVDALADEQTVASFVNASLDALYAQDMQFAPLVPDDDELLSARLSGLSDYCAGFLSGFGAVAAQATTRDALPPDVQEILRDFASISSLDDEVDGDDQDEGAFVELFEYVRVATVLTHTLMHDQLEGDAGEAQH